MTRPIDRRFGPDEPPNARSPRFREGPGSTSSVSRVLFRIEVTRDAAANHSSRTAVASRLEQPTRGLGRAVLSPKRPCGLLRRRPPTWPCSRWGLPSPPSLPKTRWALTPPFHPYPPGPKARWAVCSLLHFPWRSRHRALPGIALCGARTFLPSSSLSRGRPTGDRLYGIDSAKHGPAGSSAQGVW